MTRARCASTSVLRLVRSDVSGRRSPPASLRPRQTKMRRRVHGARLSPGHGQTQQAKSHTCPGDALPEVEPPLVGLDRPTRNVGSPGWPRSCSPQDPGWAANISKPPDQQGCEMAGAANNRTVRSGGRIKPTSTQRHAPTTVRRPRLGRRGRSRPGAAANLGYG